MSKMIQIRNVPDRVHRSLKSRAALEGLSLSDYLLREVEQLALRPTVAELWERVRGRAETRLDESAAHAVRAERDAR